MATEKYRIIGNRDLKALNAEVNKLAEEGFKPSMMQIAFVPASELEKMASQKSAGTINVVLLLEKQ